MTPGTGLSNAIAMVTGAVKQEFFPDGREFQLVEHHPDSLSSNADPVFEFVEFSIAEGDEIPITRPQRRPRDRRRRCWPPGSAFCRLIDGDLRTPHWSEIADIDGSSAAP